MRFLVNLRSVDSLQCTPGNFPWEYVAKGVIPAIARTNKVARDTWITNAKTEHQVYTLVEGLASGTRVSGNGREAANPPAVLHGLAVDYDCPIEESQARSGFERAVLPPTRWERTLSGNGRALWLFAKPVNVAGYAFCSEFMQFVADKLRVRLVAPGIDEGALKAPERCYTNSCEWFDYAGPTIESTLVIGWLAEFSNKFSFKKSEFGVSMPLDVVAGHLAAKYPRFADWPEEFALNSQGPSFWVDGSTTPKSAIVRETGMQTFSAHATKAFWPWEDLIGSAEVDKYRSNQLGEAVSGIYFDGQSYFRTIGNGRYAPFKKDDLTLHLRSTRKLSPKMDKEGSSQVDRALSYIHDNAYVVGAAPFMFLPSGIVQVNSTPVLNTSVKKALEPHPEPVVWGVDFPFISGLLDNIFAEPNAAEQKEHFLSWLAVFYQSARRQRPHSGHNVFFAGGKAVGKTLLSRKIVAGLMRGFGEASEYLLGNDDFGSELFESAVWCVDDSESATSSQGHRRFSEVVKKMAANTTFRYHGKFRVPLLVEWRGRVFVTLNADAESLRMLPDLSLTIMDKICLYKARDSYAGTSFRFPTREAGGTEAIETAIATELPKFARYMEDFVIPQHLLDETNPRHVIRPYHDAGLVNTAAQSSTQAAFAEILHDWRTTFFSGSTDKSWKGSAFQLHKLLHADPTATAALRNFSLDQMGRSLASLSNRDNSPVSCAEENGIRVWTIRALDVPSTQEPVVNISDKKSKFAK